MSKQGKRKITVDLPKAKDLANRPSVFERLGTKKNSSVKKTEFCRQWVQNGTCVYGKNCKFATTHTLVSPSKQRAANKQDCEQKRSIKEDGKNRLHSTVIVRSGRSPDGEIDNWDQNDLEYADTDVLEKRRQQLQRELELQLKMDSTKDTRGKDKKKHISSSSSSRSSSSSSVSSSSSDGSTSSSSTGREARRKGKKGKLKRNSSSSSDGEVPAKKKFIKSVSDSKKDKGEFKKVNTKKDDRTTKKHDSNKKKEVKTNVTKKSLSPIKKSGGTPPITSKSLVKNVTKYTKSPQKRERNRSVSPSIKDKDKVKSKDKEKDKEHDKERDRPRGRTRSPKKARSRSPRRHESQNPKDPRRKDSSERSRPVSPKKQIRKDGSSDRHRKRSASRDRDRGRDHKDRSLERRKDKHEEKDRHDRKDRRERNKDNKRDDKRRGRDRGLGSRGGSDKGLEKPNKPMERLLPRPEERLAALAAISGRVFENDKNSSSTKDRQDSHSERTGRKQERPERDRSNKREHRESIDREQGDYEAGLDRQYEHSHNDHYERTDDRYDDGPRENDRSPGYGMQGRDRHYDGSYDMTGPSRGYPDDDERGYGDHMSEHRGVDIGYEDRRPHRDRSWEGRSGSIERDRGFIHSHKEWDNEDYRAGGDWGRERRWSMHEAQMNDWGDKEPETDGWHNRGPPPPGPHRNHEYGRGMRKDLGRGADKRRNPRTETETTLKDSPVATQPTPQAQPRQETETGDEKVIPDDLSEISDDPDDILNREDMVDQNIDEDSQTAQPNDVVCKPDSSEKESTQDTSGAADEKESQEAKDDEDVTNLDFEEISDGELEEERTRAGLGDALGVDWASLVADVHRREQKAPLGDARSRWQPERVLTRIGLSFKMAGKDVVQDILEKKSKVENASKDKNASLPDVNVEQNGKQEESKDENLQLSTDIDSLHPVASIQVAIEKRTRQRAALFGTGCEITRALSARRDLALRRYLCQLPTAERTGQSRVTPQPSLFHAARALLMQAPVSG